VKAKRVRVNPDAPLGRNLQKILAIRVDEMWSFAPHVPDPEAVAELHDMRIAAKRVRYILETAAPALGPAAATAAKQVRKLQDRLGEIHDCDELLPQIDAHRRALRDEDVAALERDALPPNRRKYRGLATLETQVRARRNELHRVFAADWAKLERSGFRTKLETATATASVARPAGAT